MTLRKMGRLLALCTAAALLLAGLSGKVEARIVRIDITRQEPAFGGRSFGQVGAYIRLTGKAHGEIDPR
ncbi:hypothetical protein, partial [Stenotrophomonas maltophilia]|uniref:hypothetical protein n=1 Tax=Stenotrophomonas maltophilia TaxID=40324 RepID=UPI0013DAA73D